jgi:hypothetical protein
MGKTMYVVPHEGDEVLNNIHIEIAQYYYEVIGKRPVSIHERPWLLYLVVSDKDTNEGYTSIQESMYKILERSKAWGFNYRILYKGRKYYDKLDMVPKKDIITAINNDIKFVKPDTLSFVNTDSLIESINLEGIIKYYKYCSISRTLCLQTGTNWEGI